MPAEARDLSSPRCQDQLWGLSSLSYSMGTEVISWSKAAWALR